MGGSVTTLCFVVPAYRRFDLTRVCLQQLVRTCAALGEHEIEATAVLPEKKAGRARAAALYRAALAGIEGLELPCEDAGGLRKQIKLL